MAGGNLSRLYDFEVGEIIESEEVDAEFNQIVAEINDHELSNPLDHVNGSVRDNHLAEDSVLKEKIKDEQVYGIKVKSNRGQSQEEESQLVTGTLTGDPSDEDGSVLTSSGGGIGSTDEHKDRVIELVNGTVTARTLCRRYVIASNTDTTITLKGASNGGGNAYSDGFRIGNTYVVAEDTIKGRNIGEREINRKHLADEVLYDLRYAIPIVTMAVYHRRTTADYFLAQIDVPNNNTWYDAVSFRIIVPPQVAGLAYDVNIRVLEGEKGAAMWPKFRLIIDDQYFDMKHLNADSQFHWHDGEKMAVAFQTPGKKNCFLQVKMDTGSQVNGVFAIQAFDLYVNKVLYTE